MRITHPLLVVVVVGLSIYLAMLWIHDLGAAARGEEKQKGRLPGAVPCGWPATAVAVLGALVLLGLETVGEYWLDSAAHQTDVTVAYLPLMLAAAFTEELIFRGYIVITDRGVAALIAGMIGASLLFALLHPYLWSWNGWWVEIELTAGAMLTTGAVFAKSVWFYVVRFYPLNPTRSLIPCIFAHGAANAGVFIIKALQGHVVGWM
ncbi:MAG: CPBP family intramembrane glutamic endopeptidase [Planctomycetota bacterium]